VVAVNILQKSGLDMELLAAASSVAGILSLTGQTIAGITSLYGFFQDCSVASRTIGRYLKELTSLKQTVEDVNELIGKLEKDIDSTRGTGLASLKIQLEDCLEDVGKWLEKAQKSHPLSSRGTRSSFKKFLVALDKQNIKDTFGDIACHKANIRLSLSIIGRSVKPVLETEIFIHLRMILF